jgi:NTE family protein
MGKVVKLAATDRAAGASGVGRSARRRSKTALVLGGGGFTGGVYEIGALRALDLLSVNRTVNQFDVYVGTSAGAFVAAAVANGVTPEEMMRVIVQQVPTPFPDARVSALLRPNYREFVTRGLLFPLRLANLLRTVGRDLRQVSAVDIVVALAEALPSGLYSSATCGESCVIRTGPTTFASWPASCTWPRRIWTRASGSSSGLRASTRCRSPAP